jgi:hypothetical protein
MKTVMIVLIVVSVLNEAAHAENAVPSELIIGYDSEGKVDPSPQACLAHVKEVTEWDKAATERGAQQVCAARKRHADACAALQSNYKTFVEAFSQDRRLSMDHKFGITTGGHNIMIDVIENDVNAGCLTLASNLIKDETTRFTKARTQGGICPLRRRAGVQRLRAPAGHRGMEAQRKHHRSRQLRWRVSKHSQRETTSATDDDSCALDHKGSQRRQRPPHSCRRTQ